MRPRSASQLVLFFLVAAIWIYFAWPMMTKESLAIGALGGLLVHWALTNKGSKAVALIEPLTSGWRVLLYDMMLVAFLAALIQQNGSAVLDVLWPLNEKTAVLVSLISAIVVDYSVGG
ncbi:hypothetical protein E3E26_06985 [Thermococcus sp. LS1]|uniref:hypothetical protein n=1 Tax=Thermococcus sp. LS1 TaxID=1638259 RepID=UPI00143BD19E|nr:hypothetical protein [Thermococcus sp. LS1]NJD99527.1 hypothetical protein [Thermococcus sp. LS1]